METTVNDVEVCHTDEKRSGEIQRRVLLIIIDRFRRLVLVGRYQPFRQIHSASVLPEIASRLISMLPRIVIKRRRCSIATLVPMATHKGFVMARINIQLSTLSHPIPSSNESEWLLIHNHSLTDSSSFLSFPFVRSSIEMLTSNGKVKHTTIFLWLFYFTRYTRLAYTFTPLGFGKIWPCVGGGTDRNFSPTFYSYPLNSQLIQKGLWKKINLSQLVNLILYSFFLCSMYPTCFITLTWEYQVWRKAGIRIPIDTRSSWKTTVLLLA